MSTDVVPIEDRRVPSELVPCEADRGDRGGEDHATPLAVLDAADVSGSLPSRAVHDFVARAISGHATVEMQQLYSSVDGSEVRSGLAKVISLAGFRNAKAAAETAAAAGGDRGGDRAESGSPGGSKERKW